MQTGIRVFVAQTERVDVTLQVGSATQSVTVNADATLLKTAVTAGGKHLNAPYEAWIVADPFRGDVRVIITGPQGFERYVAFAMNEG